MRMKSKREDEIECLHRLVFRRQGRSANKNEDEDEGADENALFYFSPYYCSLQHRGMEKLSLCDNNNKTGLLSGAHNLMCMTIMQDQCMPEE